jgi:hypothetical protein
MNRHDHSPEGRRPGSRGAIAAAVFLTIAAFFLLLEHRAHLLGVLPYLLLLACPLLHLFHHGGHGGHGAHGAHGSPSETGHERGSAHAEPAPQKET